MKYQTTIHKSTFEVETLGGEELRIDGADKRARLVQLSERFYHFIFENDVYRVEALKTDDGYSLKINGEAVQIEVKDELQAMLDKMGGGAKKKIASGDIKAPMPGLVVKLEVAVGDNVKKGQGLLITGATGYSGSALVAHLRRQYGDSIRLKAFVRPSASRRPLQQIPVEFCEGDLLNPASLWQATAGVDVVFHSAALVSFQQKDYRKLYRANVVGARNVVNACLKSNVRRLVHISSTAAIGASESGEMSDESAPFQEWQRQIGYMASKYLAEFEIIRGVAEGLDATMLNPAIVLGDDGHFTQNDHRRSASEWIADIYRGSIPFYPAGSAGFVDIHDVVQACEAAWKRGEAGARYIISSENLSYQELAELVATFAGARCRNLAKLSPLAAKLLGASIELGAFFLGQSSALTLDSLRISSKTLRYNPAKSIAELGLSYRPLRQTVESILARRSLLR
jgi:dihydroflavonol-4-reductase